MADSITLYNYVGEPNKLDKTADLGTAVLTISSPTYRDSFDIHNPVFNFETTSANIPNVNYAKIVYGNFTRYYFCRGVNTRRGLVTFYCFPDVLTTFAAAIRGVPIIPARCADNDNNNPFLIDSRQPVETTVQHYNIPFNGDNFDYDNMSLIAGIVGTGGNAQDT